MRDVDRAIAEISDIKNQMSAAKMFRGFGPVVIAMTGLFAALITILQSVWPQIYAASPIYFLGVWVIAAIICVIVIGLEMLARSRRLHGSLAESMVQNAVEVFLPIGAAGAIIGGVLLKNTPDLAWTLPGIWQLMIGIGVFSTLRFLPRAVIIVAAWYFLAGTLTLIAGSLTQMTAPWMMGLPFIIGQILMAYILHISLEAQHDR